MCINNIGEINMTHKRLKPIDENHILHVKPLGDTAYIEALNLLKNKGFSLVTLTRELIKEHAEKVKRSEI